jgi:predicted DNA-binding transcriptional regulator AlpA
MASQNSPPVIQAPRPISCDPIVPRGEAAKILGCSVDTIDRWEAAGKMPPRIRFSARLGGWRLSTLERMIAEHTGSQKVCT